ncbi:MAG: dihydrofolate reductase family protein [Saprospiraceae bacterium]|nr:dihydrofolate reductase family protein [Pyrinomonadaceae bacterium]
MRKLTVFNFVTIDGYFKGLNEDIGWHKHGDEEAEYSAESLKSDNTLLFGRVTYEMMAGFWPTPMAYEKFPVVAEGMNNAEKIVFSKSLKKAAWNNTAVMNGNIIEKMRKMKQQPGSDMTLLGSGSISSLFADQGIVDEYRILMDPIAIGDGTPLFKGIKQNLNMKLINTRVFRSGAVLRFYQPTHNK